MASPEPTILITGGNSGIGFATIKALCEGSIAYQILLGCRSVSKGEEAVAALEKEVPNTSSKLSVLQVDLVSDESINKAAQQVSSQFGKLDVLINNAGANFDFQAQGMSTRELWNTTWDVNVTGTQILTELFVPLLLKSDNPRILFLTSGTASLNETYRRDSPPYDRINAAPEAGWPKQQMGGTAYRSVKVGLNMMMRQWCRILENDNVKIWSISPGLLATNLGGVGPEVLKKMGAKDPSEGANFIKDVVEGKRDKDVGMSIRATETQPW